MELVAGATGKLRVLSVSTRHPLRSVPSNNCGAPHATQQALVLFKEAETQTLILGLKPRGLRTGDMARATSKSVELLMMSSAPVTTCCTVPDPRLVPRPSMQAAPTVAQLRAEVANERSQSIQKDEEILLLKAQLVDAQAEAESSRSYAQHLAEEKMALLVKVEQRRRGCYENTRRFVTTDWAVKYIGGGKNNHFCGLDDFRHKVEGLLEKQRISYASCSIEYTGAVPSHVGQRLLSQVALKPWFLRLAAMSTLESQEVQAVIRGCREVVPWLVGRRSGGRNCMKRRLLTCPAASVPGYNQKAMRSLVNLARHATEAVRPADTFYKPDVSATNRCCAPPPVRTEYQFRRATRLLSPKG
ncbi:hypothetical protein Tco_0215533 [Tanacetum coccineum]